MTIIKNGRYLDLYPFLAVSQGVVDLMEQGLNQEKKVRAGKSAIKLFEAYCDITGIKVDFADLSSTSFKRTIQGFIGALYGNDLVGSSQPARMRYAKSFLSILGSMRLKVPLLPVLEWNTQLPEINNKTWLIMKKLIDAGRARYWCGWEVKTRKNRSIYLPIGNITSTYGPDFADSFYENIKLFVEKQSHPSLQEFRGFISFLNSNSNKYSAETFRNPIKISSMFKEYMRDSFVSCYEKGNDIAVKKRMYSKFMTAIDETFFQSGVWAKPFEGHLSRPASQNKPGGRTNIKRKENGVEIKDKLITPIPLNITDTEAIELLFKIIDEDINTVLRWAKYETRILGKALTKRENLAQYGAVLPSKYRLYKSLETTPLEHLCATLKTAGYYGLRKIIDSTYARCDFARKSAAKKLAIPNINDFYPFHYILIHGHPCITSSFLNEFELYNKNGALSGFIKTDHGYQLVGYKDRKGTNKSEQNIDLTPREAVLIRQIIRLTQPLREAMRTERNDSWRYLFLHGYQALGTPRKCQFSKWSRAKILGPECNLISQFKMHSKIQDDVKLADFIHRVSPASFRASCGVSVYLQTQSAEAMSKALGHTNYTPSLLSHYLPEPIQTFFQSRWVRIFQRGLICEAMKDSPHLLLASSFGSMVELHEFLKNHTLREIPIFLQDPEGIPTTQFENQTNQVYISIDSWILSTLLSLQSAVIAAKEKLNISALAKHWSELTGLIVKEIRRTDDPILTGHLEKARLSVDSTRMEHLIYETAT